MKAFSSVARQALFGLGLTLAASISASTTSAGVIFHVGAGAVQPPENLLFNAPGLISTGTTVEGETNQTNSLVQIISNDNPLETLTTPAQGQARIEAVDGAYSSVMIVPQGGYITEMEFNVNVLNQESGTFQLSLLDQFNNVILDTFNPNTLGQGENFFSFETDGGTFIQKATLTASGQIIQDLRQIRLGISEVPEPGSLALVLSTLPLGLLRFRRTR
jgi:hypothetical protein